MFGRSPNWNILVLKCEACDSLVLCLPEQKPLNKTHLRDKTLSQNTSIQGIPEKVSFWNFRFTNPYDKYGPNKQTKWYETVQIVQNCPKYPKWSDTVQYGPKWSRRVIWICGPKISVKYFFLGHPVRAKSMYYLYMYTSKYQEYNMK